MTEAVAPKSITINSGYTFIGSDITTTSIINESADDISFANNFVGPLTLSGGGAGSLTFTAANVGAGKLTTSTTVTLEDGWGGAVINTGDLTVSGSINKKLDNNGAGTVTTSGDLTGITTLTQDSTGLITISDDDTLSADTIKVKAGSGGISVGVNSILAGTGNTLNNNATIDVADGGTITDAGAIKNKATGIINFAGDGTLTADDDMTNDEDIINKGALNIDGGTVTASTGGAGKIKNTGMGTIVVDANATLILLDELVNSSLATIGVDIATDATLTGTIITINQGRPSTMTVPLPQQR